MHTSLQVIAVIVPIIAITIIIFSFAMIFNPKLRGKMMSKQIKSFKSMLEYSKDDLNDLASHGIQIEKNILDTNEDDLRNINKKITDINKDAIETTARAIKKGLTDDDKVYCKHCGSLIDNDSKFCKNCGNKI